ncbi:hypothetical protein Hanom_Chr15g01398121 [Helianthus anomalus]
MLCLLYAIKFVLVVFEFGVLGVEIDGGGRDRWWRWWRLMVVEVVMDGGCFFLLKRSRENNVEEEVGVFIFFK